MHEVVGQDKCIVPSGSACMLEEAARGAHEDDEVAVHTVFQKSTALPAEDAAAGLLQPVHATSSPIPAGVLRRTIYSQLLQVAQLQLQQIDQHQQQIDQHQQQDYQMQMQSLRRQAEIQQLTEEIRLLKRERCGMQQVTEQVLLQEHEHAEMQQQVDRICAERQQRAEEVLQLKRECSRLRDAVVKQSSHQNQTANSLVAAQLTALDKEVQSLPYTSWSSVPASFSFGSSCPAACLLPVS